MTFFLQKASRFFSLSVTVVGLIVFIVFLVQSRIPTVIVLLLCSFHTINWYLSAYISLWWSTHCYRCHLLVVFCIYHPPFAWCTAWWRGWDWIIHRSNSSYCCWIYVIVLLPSLSLSVFLPPVPPAPPVHHFHHAFAGSSGWRSCWCCC